MFWVCCENCVMFHWNPNCNCDVKSSFESSDVSCLMSLMCLRCLRSPRRRFGEIQSPEERWSRIFMDWQFLLKCGCLCHPNFNEWHLCTTWITAVYYYMITLPLCDIVMMWEQHCAGVTRYGSPAPCHECHECHGAEKQFAGHSQLRQNTDNSPFPLGCLAQDPATAERDFRSTHIRYWLETTICSIVVVVWCVGRVRE